MKLLLQSCKNTVIMGTNLCLAVPITLLGFCYGLVSGEFIVKCSSCKRTMLPKFKDSLCSDCENIKDIIE